ncbi:unnamed protein product [Calypogeia fissa]
MARSGAAFKRGKPVSTLLAVICGKKVESNGSGAASTDGPAKSAELLPNVSGVENDAFLLPGKEKAVEDKGASLPGYPDLVSSGQLEVQLLQYPTKEELKSKLESLQPEFVSFHGEQVAGKDDVGGLALDDAKACTPDELVSLFGTKLPDFVYLEIPSGDKSAQALQTLGVKHVIYWKASSCSNSLALHFRQGLLATLQSSGAGGWDGYHLAKACSQIYGCQSRLEGHSLGRYYWPLLLGDTPPKIELPPAEAFSDGEGSKASETTLGPIQIFDDDVEIRLLVCTELTKPDNGWFDAMEAGLSCLLTIEARALRMLNRISAPPPPMAAAVFARGIVTMRCDLCTASYARVPLLVSGSAQLCFDDQSQQLESSIKRELVERVRLVRILKAGEEKKAPALIAEVRRSVALAGGARVLEFKIITPAWAGQVLRQLSAEPSYRSLVALGIAGVQGSAVAAFRKEDAILLASSKFERSPNYTGPIPDWFKPPVATKKRVNLFQATKSLNENPVDQNGSSSIPKSAEESSSSGGKSESQTATGTATPTKSERRFTNLAPMKPIPHKAGKGPHPYAAVVAAANAGWSMKVNMPNGTSGKMGRPHSNSVIGHGTSNAASGPGNYTPSITPGSLLLAANAPLVKPHGCSRQPIDDCAEEDFLSDLIKFLVSRGHGRLIPPAGAEAFPEVVLNGKRLDLYNLYREVVSRGGFHVGNGINWKGQVFSKMRNHTLTNKMTGVGNTLKKHYETYLLEYELAHNDVDGECCILCHSGAAGDWVNCGSCGEWAHFGCDKRTGLGTFKEYSKTDGLEYICPNCSTANGRLTKRRKVSNSADGAEAAITKGVPRRTARG